MLIPARFSKARGFTLLEMMITLAIFILLCAAIFGIVSGVLKGSSGLMDNQNRQDQITGLDAYLKNKLTRLPAQSFLMSYRRGTGDGLNQNGIVFGGNGGLVAIDATPQGNGHYVLRRGLVPLNGTIPSTGGIIGILPDGLTTDEDPSLNWIPLIQDVKTIEWKFQEPNDPQWEDSWKNASAKPNLVELTIQLAGDLQPTVMDFWIPPIVPVTLTMSQQSGTTQTGTLTSPVVHASQ